MKLYHGTNCDIYAIDFGRSRVAKDFGVGFYLTPDAVVAGRQARRRSAIDGGKPVVCEYEFDEKALVELATCTFPGFTQEWARFVQMNRGNRTRVNMHAYDIVVGPIADDDIGMQMREYAARHITLQQFLSNIKFRDVCMQYFFATERALTYLHRL